MAVYLTGDPNLYGDIQIIFLVRMNSSFYPKIERTKNRSERNHQALLMSSIWTIQKSKQSRPSTSSIS